MRRTTADVLGMSPRQFLGEHWQKKPLLVRGAFPDFRDPVTPEELAGLACEDGVESRLVVRRGKRWEVVWGPHAEAAFADLPKRAWTLLVQEVNRWVPDAALLLEPFSFLPNVRVDDVMVSYAAPGGGVGPHVDSYDVFLVQGRGKRRWQFHARPTGDRAIRAGLDLRILERFVPDVDEVLGPGDMLYLPPGFAHHGTAETECMTYSVGFRSPSAGEAWTSFAAHGARRGGADLLVDPPLAPAGNPGEIPAVLRERVRALVRSQDLSDAAIDRWFASHATRLKPGHELEAPRRPLDGKTILTRLRAGKPVHRSEEARWAYLEHGASLDLFVGGEEHFVPREATALAKTLCAARRFDGKALLAVAKAPAARELLEALFAKGTLRFA